jgi:hypothetical protein
MRDRGWSRVRLFEEVGAELGYAPKSRSAILPLLEDKNPTEQQAAVLARHFGWPTEPDPAPAGATETPDPLVTALAAQTAALTALVDELRLWRSEDRERLSGVEAVVDRLVVGALGGPDIPSVGAPRVPDGTAG